MTSPLSAVRLDGRLAVVTGASSGIGAATAGALVAAGARVALLGRRTGRLETVAEQTGQPDGVLVVTADVSDGLQLADALDAVNDRFGTVDLVVAAAGVLTGAPFENSVPAEWAAMLDVNVTGMLSTALTFARDLLSVAESGRTSDLFLVGGLAGKVRYPGYAAYSAAEAAVAQLSRALRAEYGWRGLRVHNVAVGLTETEFGSTITDPAMAQDWRALRGVLAPIDPQDVARAVLFSASLPARVNVAELLMLPTAQDRYLPTRRGESLP